MTMAQLTALIRADVRASKPRKAKAPTTVGSLADLLALAEMPLGG